MQMLWSGLQNLRILGLCFIPLSCSCLLWNRVSWSGVPPGLVHQRVDTNLIVGCNPTYWLSAPQSGLLHVL